MESFKFNWSLRRKVNLRIETEHLSFIVVLNSPISSFPAASAAITWDTWETAKTYDFSQSEYGAARAGVVCVCLSCVRARTALWHNDKF